jgi:AraC family transcriptional regulator
MKPAEQATDKIFARPPHFVVHYRAGRRLRWSNAARTDYAALLLLQGRMRWRVEADELIETPKASKTSATSETRAIGKSTTTSETRKTSETNYSTRAGELSEGTTLLAAPGDRLSASSAGTAAYLLVTLAPVFVFDCAARARLTHSDAVVSFRTHAIERDERLARLARDLAEELLEENAGQELVVAALVEHALVHLLRRYANLRRSEQLELSRVGLVDRRIRLAVELMHAHLERDLSLEEIAQAAHLSPFHFSRLFKKLTGATPHAYLASLRAARAQTLLAETDLSITEIGARVGYMSSSHFAKAFRQATGISPRAYRKALVRG